MSQYFFPVKLTLVLNSPVGWGTGGKAHRGDAQPIQEPHRHRARITIAPDNIGFAIPIDITRNGNLPRLGHPAQVSGGGNRGAIHQPNHDFPSTRVAPDQVGLPVSIDITHPRNLPIRGGTSGKAH